MTDVPRLLLSPLQLTETVDNSRRFHCCESCRDVTSAVDAAAITDPAIIPSVSAARFTSDVATVSTALTCLCSLPGLRLLVQFFTE